MAMSSKSFPWLRMGCRFPEALELETMSLPQSQRRVATCPELLRLDRFRPCDKVRERLLVDLFRSVDGVDVGAMEGAWNDDRALSHSRLAQFIGECKTFITKRVQLVHNDPGRRKTLEVLPASEKRPCQGVLGMPALRVIHPSTSQKRINPEKIAITLLQRLQISRGPMVRASNEGTEGIYALEHSCLALPLGPHGCGQSKVSTS
mmetsp:Transcript_117655/g.293322  ORF Transcript_117655/g.293322 Transcript_117655/m.293322 type:complete len:205 (+) Transcript_117655:476-1090(+)